MLHDAIAKAFGRDRPAVQRCQLLVGDLGEVAVLAKHDACGTAHVPAVPPDPVHARHAGEDAAEAAAATMDGRTFYAEDKLDGIRARCTSRATAPTPASRSTRARWTAPTPASPTSSKRSRKLPGEFLLDGEIVPWCDGCVLPFAHIQKRLGRKVLTPKILRDNPAAFVAFDVLYQDGELLMDRAAAANGGRRCERCCASADAGDCDDARSRCDARRRPRRADRRPSSTPPRDRRNEGIILKDPDSPYSPGRRGQMWLKLKTHLPTLDCVVTAAEYGHGKRRNSLSDYTFAVWDREPTEAGAKLVNVGKAYSGVTDEEIAQLTELFLKISRGQQFGRVHAVEPQVVLEIACDQIQPSKRHASGYALRFPRIKRIRWDKRPEDADRLSA